MPNKPVSFLFGNTVPRYLDTDAAITGADLERANIEALQSPETARVSAPRAVRGVTLLIRTARGADTRGGYLFQYRHTDTGIRVWSYRKEEIPTFSDWTTFATFVNHVCGKVFDQTAWELCQQINLRIAVPDPDVPGAIAGEGD